MSENKAHNFMIARNNLMLKKIEKAETHIANYKKLYIAANELLLVVGADGQITTDDTVVDELMSVLADIDEGSYDVKKVFKE